MPEPQQEKDTQEPSRALNPATHPQPAETYLNGAGKPICGAPCYYGGVGAAKKHSKAELGWMFHCNQVVHAVGDRCWRHPAEPDAAAPLPAAPEHSETAPPDARALLGIAPDWTGGLTTDEYMREQRSR